MFWQLVFCSILVLFPAFTLSAQQKTTAVQAHAEFRITGTMVDSVTGQPIAKARVAAAPVTARDQFSTVVTGPDGRFFFPNLAPGKYTLVAQRHGYLSQAFNQHEQYSTAIAVGPDLESDHLIFHLPPECSISGTITDEAGEGVSDAQVNLYRDGMAGGAQEVRLMGSAGTDDEGAFRFGHLTPGQYILAVEAPVWYAQRPETRAATVTTFYSVSGHSAMRGGPITGPVPSSLSNASAEASSNGGERPEAEPRSPLDVTYPITFYPGVTDSASATPITLKAGEKFAADLSLQPVPALHFTVPGLSPAGNVSRAVQLQQKLFPGSDMGLNAEVRSTASGKLEMVGVPPGQYTLKLTDYGPNGSQTAMERQIEVGSNGMAEDISGKAGVRVTAMVKLAPGAAMPVRSYLQLYSLKTRDYFYERVPENGEVEYKHAVPPGGYQIAITPGNGAFIKSVAGLGASISGRMVTIKGPGEAKLSVVLDHGYGQLAGLVLRHGKPLAGAMVLLVPADEADNAVLFRRDQSDSDGTFTLSNVVPGRYTVMAIENGWDLDWRNPEVRKNYAVNAVAVDVEPNGRNSVKVIVE